MTKNSPTSQKFTHKPKNHPQAKIYALYDRSAGVTTGYAEAISQMFTDFGLSVAASIDRIEDYGCWCPKAFQSENHLVGAPLDELDGLCRKYASCCKCEKASQWVV